MTEYHERAEGLVRLVQVIPSGEVMTRLPVPDVETATKRPLPYPTPTSQRVWPEVRFVHARPSEEVSMVPPSPTAMNWPPPCRFSVLRLISGYSRCSVTVNPS